MGKKILATLPGFDGLAKEELDKVFAIAVTKKHEKKELLFSDGERGAGFFVIVRGRVKVLKVSPEGKEVILHLCGPGDHIGQVAIFAGHAYPASAETLTDCDLLFFPRQAMIDLIGREPQLALSLLAVLSARLRQLTNQVESLALKEVPGRLAAYLLYLAEERETPGTVTLDTSKVHLASMLGTTPETLSRIFADMVERGLVGVDRREVTLLDQEGLQRLAERGKYGT